MELSGQLWRWIARLLPKQKNQGAGAVQVGKAGGDVEVVTNVSHTVNNVSTSHVTIVVSAAVEPVAPMAPEPVSPPVVTADQREVLRMMRRLPNEEAVFVFMQREFGTRRVIGLKPRELFRLRRYVESIHRKMGIDVDKKK